ATSIWPCNHNLKSGRPLMITAADAGASTQVARREPSASTHEVIDTVEAHQTDHDQVDRNDEIEQPRHEKDQDAGNEGNDRRDMGDGQRHGGLSWVRMSKLRDVSAGSKLVRSTSALPLDMREIRDRSSGRADAVEQLEAVLAQLFLVGAVGDIDRHLVEEGIDMRAKPSHGAHGGFEVLARNRSARLIPRDIDGLGERPLFVLAVKCRIRLLGIGTSVFFLLDAKDVGGTLVAGEKILSVLGVEKLAQRLDPADDRDNTGRPASKMKDRVDQIVPRTLLAQLHFQPPIEK